MKEFNADLHFHGLYSGGVSKKMLIPVIAEQSKLKGLHLVGTADILHGKWLEHVKENVKEESNGVFVEKKSSFPVILQTEVQGNDQVHHVVFFPDFNAVEQAKEEFKKFSSDIDSFGGGRPRIRLNGEQIAEVVEKSGGMIGPAHAFTPYFGVYAHFSSLKECYGEMHEKIHFIELGLSADSYFADLIKENHSYTFLTASDSHSPWPYRIGREFTRIKMKEPSFNELKKALKERDEKRITLNAGFNPKEGKYHCSACNSCFTRYPAAEAEKLEWRCRQCNKTIKKGVKDRILELASFQEETHPSFRPPYLHLIPLAEIIQEALGQKNVFTMKVQGIWGQFIQEFGSEINALVDAPIEELEKVNAVVASKVNSFRKGFVLYLPGGGGDYGKPIICANEKEFEQKKEELKRELNCESPASTQRTLGEF